MPKLNFSISFIVEADEPTTKEAVRRLNPDLVGRIKDLIALALAGLDFDLREQYHLVLPQPSPDLPIRPRTTQAIPIWSPIEGKVIEVAIGSPEWFNLIEQHGRFKYQYGSITFTVRLETRQSKGKPYTYWRAYITLKGRLFTRQIGPTAKLSLENLEAAGAYFAGLVED